MEQGFGSSCNKKLHHPDQTISFICIISFFCELNLKYIHEPNKPCFTLFQLHQHPVLDLFYNITLNKIVTYFLISIANALVNSRFTLKAIYKLSQQ